jgi:ketosteroid isomerase-like protein
LLERWLDAGDAGDVEAFHELLHDDAVVHEPLGPSSDGKASELWEVADVGVLLRGGG